MSRKSMFSIFIVALPIFGLVHQAAAKERQGTVTFQVSLDAPAEAKKVKLWVPYPMSDKNQDITAVSVNGNYAGMGVYKEPKDGAPALYAEWKTPMKERTLTYTFTIKRKEVVTRNFPKEELPLPAEELKHYLDNSHLGNSEKRVKEIVAEITKGKKTVLEKSRAVYDWVVDNMRRDPNEKGFGLCEIERLLTEKAGKCGGRVHLGTGGAAPLIVDFETGRHRPTTTTDLYDIARLVDTLEHIHFYWRSIVARDMPTWDAIDLNTVYACMQGTTKHITSSFNNGDSVRTAVAMLDLRLGGEGEFRKRPFCSMACTHVVPPLRFAKDSCEAMEAAVRAGMPVGIVSAPQAGATSPVTLAGTASCSPWRSFPDSRRLLDKSSLRH